jgi:uncharacterized repeat protein (TIGR03806 family)
VDQQVLATGELVTSIIEDRDGEPLIIAYNGNIATRRSIFRLERSDPPAGDFPLLLSDAPWLIDLAKGGEAAGVLPYDVIAPLWSDGAVKTRFLAVPGLDKVGYRGENAYAFTTDTLFIKNFHLPLDRRQPAATKLIETRLLIKRDGQWRGFSYQWTDDETDGFLLSDEAHRRDFDVVDETGTTVTQTWTYPSRTDCLRCHTDVKNGVLGFETVQINRDFDYGGATDNQLRTLEHIGLFEEALPGTPETLPRLIDPRDNRATLTARVKAYLHANCAMCHQPGGTTPTTLDLRWQTPLEEMVLVNVQATHSAGELADLGVDTRIAPGMPETSALDARMAAGAGKIYKMPPLARAEIDPFVDGVVRPWILQLGGVLAAEPEWILYP